MWKKLQVNSYIKRIKKTFDFRKVRLSYLFFLTGLSVFIVFLVFSIICSIRIFFFYEKETFDKLHFSGKKIETYLEDMTRHTAYTINMILEQIKENPNDLDYVDSVIKKFKVNPVLEGIVSWAAFSWINDKNFVVVDSLYGKMKTPLNLSCRDYILKTRQRYGKLYLGSPVLGSTSGVSIIPCGIGAINKEGKYIGTLVVGFKITSLLNQLRSLINKPGMEFCLIDEKGKIILSSKEPTLDFPSSPILTAIKRMDISKEDIPKNLKRKFSWNLENYYTFKLSNHPYFVYIKYEKESIFGYLFSHFLFHTLEVFIFFLLISIILAVLYFKVIKPFVFLSEEADRISRGNFYSEKHRNKSFYEIESLRTQLLRVKNHLNREKKSKEKLEKAIQIAESSNKIREEFIEQIRKETTKSLEQVIDSSRALHSKLEKNLHMFTKEERFDLTNILKSIQRSPTSKSCEKVDLPHLIQECIDIHSKTAYQRNISIKYNNLIKEKEFYGDELKLKQILVGVIGRSLEFLKDRSTINVKAEIKYVNNIKSLLVEIKDNGFGLNASDRKRIKRTNDDQTEPMEQIIETLVSFHKGIVEFRDVYGEGSLITVTLPAIMKDQLELNSKKILHFPQKY